MKYLKLFESFDDNTKSDLKNIFEYLEDLGMSVEFDDEITLYSLLYL